MPSATVGTYPAVTILPAPSRVAGDPAFAALAAETAALKVRLTAAETLNTTQSSAITALQNASSGGASAFALVNGGARLSGNTKSTATGGVVAGFNAMTYYTGGVAFGDNTLAGGNNSFAHGYRARANGHNSFAYGRFARIVQGFGYGDAWTDSYYSPTQMITGQEELAIIVQKSTGVAIDFKFFPMATFGVLPNGALIHGSALLLVRSGGNQAAVRVEGVGRQIGGQYTYDSNYEVVYSSVTELYDPAGIVTAEFTVSPSNTANAHKNFCARVVTPAGAEVMARLSTITFDIQRASLAAN